MLSKSQAPSSVFVAIVYDGVAWECSEVVKRSDHLCTDPFEETATAGHKERVASEHSARLACRGIGDVIADRVLRVAGRRQTSDLN